MFSCWRAGCDQKPRTLCALCVQLATWETRDSGTLDASIWLQRHKQGKMLLNDLFRYVVHFPMVSADVSTGPD